MTKLDFTKKVVIIVRCQNRTGEQVSDSVKFFKKWTRQWAENAPQVVYFGATQPVEFPQITSFNSQWVQALIQSRGILVLEAGQILEEDVITVCDYYAEHFTDVDFFSFSNLNPSDLKKLKISESRFAKMKAQAIALKKVWVGEINFINKFFISRFYLSKINTLDLALFLNSGRLLHDWPAIVAKIPVFMRAPTTDRQVLDSILRTAKNLTKKPIFNKSAEGLIYPRILFVTHSDIESGSGGVELHVKDLIKSISPHQDVFLIFRQWDGLYLRRYSQKATKTIRLTLDASNYASEFSNPQLERKFKKALLHFNIDVVHFHHLLNLPWSVYNIAKQHCKVAYTAHDYYAFCGRYDLINDKKQFCNFSNDYKECDRCLGNSQLQPQYRVARSYPGYAQQRRQNLSTLLQDAKLIFPSEFAKKTYSRILPIQGADAVVLECPINEKKIISKSKFKTPTKANINIAFVGNFSQKKGSQVFKRIVEKLALDKGMQINWFVFGKVEDLGISVQLAEKYKVKFFGNYSRDTLPGLLTQNNIHLGLILSVWPETYSYTLTEIFQSGIPAVVTDIGAPAQRIASQGGGWSISIEKCESDFHELLKKLISKPDMYMDQRKRIPQPVAFSQQIQRFMDYYLDLNGAK